MALDYDSLTKEELIRHLEEATRPPSLGLYWERNRTEHDRAPNDDFVALDLDRELSCGAAPRARILQAGTTGAIPRSGGSLPATGTGFGRLCQRTPVGKEP